MSAIPITFLSWNTARLLALVLNSLTGLLQYYEREQNNLDMDALFGLRVIQGHLDEVSWYIQDQHHQKIATALRNISSKAREIVENVQHGVQQNNLESFKELKILFSKSQKMGLNLHKRIEERYRWPNKDLMHRDKNHEGFLWFSRDQSPDFYGCLKFMMENECELKNDCIEKILKPTGFIGYKITRQLLFISVAKMLNCDDKMNEYLNSFNPPITNITEYSAERCTNIYDESAKFRKDKKKLARISHFELDLLMEQVFVCLQFGYLDFANPHSIVTALAWQHPELGCYTIQKPETNPKISIGVDIEYPSNNKLIKNFQSEKQDTCIMHTSTVVGLSLMVFVRYLLDPGPWAELRFADQVHIDQIVAEDRFTQFKYIDWVRDSQITHEVYRRMPKLPPVAWSPDLVAFVFLLMLCVIGTVIWHYLFTNSNSRIRHVKQLYPYSFKKL